MKKDCEICGEEFSCPNGRKDRKTCSKKCQGRLKSRRGNILRKCPQCGKLFLVNKHMNSIRVNCSLECNGKSRHKRVVKRCSVCPKTYEIQRSKAKNSMYCSAECSHKAKRKVLNRPNAEQLQYLLKRVTLKNISEMYEVSGTTIQRWCNRAGVIIPNNSERNRLKKLKRIGKLS